MTVAQTSHPLGDMTLFAWSLILKCNPRVVIVENAPSYGASETGVALVGGLQRLGYHVTNAVVNANDFGGLTQRKRTVIIAQTPEADGTVPAALPLLTPNTRTVRSFLDTEIDNAAWFDRTTKAWVFTHAEKQAAKGNGFRFQIVDPDATVMPVIKKRYLAGQGDSPMLAHPTKPDTYRWFTLAEIARFTGLSDHYQLGTSKTTAGEIIGQAVDIPTFTKILAQATGRGDTRRILATTAAAEAPDDADAESVANTDAVTGAVTGTRPATSAAPNGPVLARRPPERAVQGTLFLS